jgi:hypothetical protein
MIYKNTNPITIDIVILTTLFFVNNPIMAYGMVNGKKQIKKIAIKNHLSIFNVKYLSTE